MKGKLLGAFLVVVLVTQPVAAMGGGLNYDSGDAPNPTITAETTVDSYQVAWGDDPQYEDDSGKVVDLPATVNTSTDVDELGNGAVNPYTFTVTDVNFSAAGEFPRSSDDASALDASEWSTSGASLTETTTAPGVDAIDYTASTSGDSATYSNFTISSDAEKRYFQTFYDVTDASGATEITATIHDATDGDTATVYLYDADGNTADAAVGANSTGEGAAMQVQMGDLAASGGDSTLDEIGQVVISADGAGSADISALNLEKQSQWELGTQYVNTDTDDDDLETETVYNATGPISINSVESMGSTFDDADINGLTFEARFSASQLADEDVSAEFASDNAYPQWDSVLTANYRLELPSAYDLSYANAELVMTQQWAETRYVSVEVAEGVSDDTNLTNVSDSDYTGVTSSFTSEGDEVSMDSTVSVGSNYDVQVKLLLTGDEASAMQSAGGGGVLGGGGGGGIIGWLIGLPGVVIAAVGGLYARSKGVI